jgi:hypothetical protein
VRRPAALKKAPTNLGRTGLRYIFMTDLSSRKVIDLTTLAGQLETAVLKSFSSKQLVLIVGSGRDSCHRKRYRQARRCTGTCNRLVPQGVVGSRNVGDVVQLVRTLLSNRRIDVSDLKISNLTQITSGRPVTVPSTFPAFRVAPVRSPAVPRSRDGSKMNPFPRCCV